VEIVRRMGALEVTGEKDAGRGLAPRRKARMPKTRKRDPPMNGPDIGGIIEPETAELKTMEGEKVIVTEWELDLRVVTTLVE
jgi:hypothetical protein